MLRVQHTYLADPRTFAADHADPLVALASAQGKVPALVERLRGLLQIGDDDAIRTSLRAAASPAVYRCLWVSLNRAVAGAAAQRAGVQVQAFAIPVLLIVGAARPVTLAGVLPDVARIRTVLEDAGALGPARNVGFGNALVALSALEAIAPSRIAALPRAGTVAPIDLPPAPIAVATQEAVHLRFILGAAVCPADAPSFLETGSASATWGMALTRELGEQLGAEGVSVLPIPRPPATLLEAQEVGRRAREELALQVFVSRELRRSRAEVGEPEVTVAALDSGEIGVRIASPFIENRVAVHAWALHPLDDLAAVQAAIIALLRECRVERVEVLAGIADRREFARNPAARGAH